MLTPEKLGQIIGASRSVHPSGSMSVPALLALAKHLQTRAVHYSVETGTGASTLVFSHLSRRHEVFTVNTDDSMTRVMISPLLNKETTAFIEGPSQKTLPGHRFPCGLQAVLLDGPHAYPLPDLEYFYFYPHIEAGGLLIIDDIHIPTIHNLFRFLRSESMFRLLEVSGKTAFFERTSVPLFDPWGDGWWLQARNSRTVLRYSWRDKIKVAVPRKWRSRLWTYADRIRLRFRS